MSGGLLKDIKLSQASADQVQAPVSLEELLIEEIERSASARQGQPTQEKVAAPEPKTSRRTRRKRLKTSKVVNRTKFQSSGKSSVEQDRKNKEYQERNKKALLKRQKQADQKSQTGSIDRKISAVGGIAGRSVKNRQSQSREVLVKEVRPVIIGSVEYTPIFNSGSRTAAGRALKMKRSVRRLKVDRLVRLNDPFDTTMPAPAAVDLIANYINAHNNFLSSVDPRRLEMYKDALSAFALNIDEESSTTEVLYTLVGEYARALRYGSSRLDESSNRVVEPGTSLVSTKDPKIEDYYSALKSSGNNDYKKIIDADVQDIELAVKCLSSILSKEVLCSYNVGRYGITNYPINLFRARKRTTALVNPPSRGDRLGADRHGVVYTDSKDGKAIKNYPFEMSSIISNKASVSIPDFISRAVSQDDSTYPALDEDNRIVQYSSPYQASSAGFEQCAKYVSQLLSREDLDYGSSAFLTFFVDAVRNLSYIGAFASLSSDLAIQLQILCEAAENKMTFDHLMVYLAFRQEKLTNYEGGEPPDFGPSTVLRRSNTLKGVLKRSVSSGKVTTSYVSRPKDVKVTPSPTGDGQTEFTAPETTTTTTVEQDPTTGQVGTLESMFDTTYEEVCESFAALLTKRFGYNSASGLSIDSSKTKTYQVTSLEDMLKRSTSSSMPVFDLLLQYQDRIQQGLPDSDPDSEDDITIYTSGDGSRTKFSRLRKDSCFVAYSMLICKISKLMTRDRLVVTYPGSSSKSYMKSKTQVGIKNSKSSPTSSPFTIRFSTDWQSSIDDLRAFVDSSELDFTDIVDSYPLIAAVCAALVEEENFLFTFASSLSDYFSEISNNFDDILAALSVKTGGVTLAQRMSRGFTPSVDMLKLLKSYSFTWNARDMIYNGIKTRDKVTSPEGFATLEYNLKDPQLSSAKKKKILCVGLPAGILQSAKNAPSEIGEVSGFAESASSEDTFKIVVQKIDQADPDIRYEDKEFTFSRSLFCIGSNPDLRFVKIDDDLNCTELRRLDAHILYGDEILNNHILDFTLKQYSDLQLDIDFNESAFCNSEKYTAMIKDGDVPVPALKNVDLTSESFLTASNLAFDPLARKMVNMKFFKPDRSVITIGERSSNDAYDYSAYDFANSYGNIFLPNEEDDRLKEGVTFEKTVCVLIDDDSFEMDLSDVEEDSRETNSELLNRLVSQKMVGIGRETSEGVDLFTYRVSIMVGE